MLSQKNFVEEFIEYTIFNMPEVLEYYQDIKETREYQTLPELRKVIDTYFNNFCFNNGLYYKLDDNLTNKDDEKSTLLYLLTLGNRGKLPTNRYRRQIIKYYFEAMNDNKLIKDVRFEDIKAFKADDYYSHRPPIYCKIINPTDEDLIKLRPKLEVSKTAEQIIKHTTDFIKIGQSIQFNIKGFPMNQLLYLLVGIAIYSASKSKFNTFKELIDYLKSFIQLNLSSICINTIDTTKNIESDNFYNLITYLMFDVDKEEYNMRYKPAHKYFKDYKLDEHVQVNKTLFKTKYDETSNKNQAFITTEYPTKEDVLNVWQELEDEWNKNNKTLSKELIVKWFDGQLLTRSTCLIGVILIILEENKIIRFEEDEMPDWKSIALNNYSNTYSLISDIPDLKIPEISSDVLTLKDVLIVVLNYINIICRHS